jgi:hypothetical protein
MVARLGEPDAARAFETDDAAAAEARERAAAVRARLNNAASEYAAGDIDEVQLRIISAKLRPQLDAAESDVRRHRAPALPANLDVLFTAPEAERAAIWGAMTVTSKRTIMTALNITVTILPKRQQGRGGFDENEIIIETVTK